MSRVETFKLADGEEIRLTDREKLFCEYFLADSNRNATDAAIKAGYSARTARTIAAQNLARLNIQKYIQFKTAPLLEQLGINQLFVLKELKAIASANISHFMNNDYTMKSIDEIDPDMLPAIQSVEVDGDKRKYKQFDKMRGLEKLWDILNPKDGVENEEKRQILIQINNSFGEK